MISRWRNAVAASLGLSLVLFLLIFAAPGPLTLAQSGQKSVGQSAQPQATRTAAEAFKNIKVLKDIPSYELIPTMEFISASLGVHCGYCHVEHHFNEDTKKTKRRARQMMKMMFAIDRANFHGHLAVTCNTCHHGSPHPTGTPAIAEAGEVLPRTAHGEEHGRGANLASLPQPDTIVARYVAALGGVDALRKVRSRVMTGTMTAFGHTMPVEIYAKAPDERASVLKFKRGKSMTVYNGHKGWASMMPRPPHPLEGSELDRARFEADFYFPLDIQKLFTKLHERPPHKVGGEEAYEVLGIRPGKPPVQLFFSKQSGLLLRVVYFTQTALGRLPQQTDYSDYREVDGVKVPFQWIVAEPHGHSTVQLAQVRQNVPISATKFAVPDRGGLAGE